MTDVKVKGVRRVVSKGNVYYYHRASGERINADPNDAVAFLAEVKRLEALAPIVEKPKVSINHLGGLIAAYKGSPEWLILSKDTHKAYNRVFDAISNMHNVPARDITPAHVLRARDAIYKKSGRWLANQTVAVFSLVFTWGVPREIVPTNVAKGVPKIRRSRSAGIANKSWLPGEVAVLLDRAGVGLRKAVALAYYAGLRKKDCVEALEEERDTQGIIELVSSKPGRVITVFEAQRLTAILNEKHDLRWQDEDAKHDPSTATLVMNRMGNAYTRDGLDSNWQRLKTALVKEGKIRKGLTFHGLRKSLGKDAAAAGFGENDIAGVLGQANPASARPYTAEHKQREAARKVIRALERRGKR